jgi:hypothetical protein
MSGKPVRFHPEADQEYLSSLVWYNEATQPRLILKMNSSGQSLPSQKRLSVGRFIFRLAADTFFINSPSASCTAISNEDVFVLAVAHAHRRPGYWRKRLRP